MYLARSVDQQTLRQTLRLFWPTTTKLKRSNQILKNSQQYSVVRMKLLVPM